MTQPP
jgi:hypothetical protein